MVEVEGQSSGGIERLRTSRARYVERTLESGREYGERWAKWSATYGELKRLAHFAKDESAVNELLESWDPNAAPAKYRIVLVIFESPAYGFSDGDVRAFWERWFDDANDSRLNCPHFLRGFIEGAVAFLECHEDEIES
jgi:hypothetical protein